MSDSTSMLSGMIIKGILGVQEFLVPENQSHFMPAEMSVSGVEEIPYFDLLPQCIRRKRN